MADLFLKIINMSISANWIVLAVLLLRWLLQKAPKWISVLLWGVVAVRLICPFSIESVMSLIPSAETISPQVLIERPEINTGIPILNNTLNPIIQDATIAVAPEKSINTLQLFVLIFSKVWVVGVAGMLSYIGISYFRVKNKIGSAVLLRENIFQSENVVSPFVLGIIRPEIYLPFQMNGQDMEHVIAHERAHLRRKDHLWKPLGFLILTLHWFNPLIWLGYVLLCRDIELACDEKVVKEFSAEQKADYSQALLTCSVNRRIIAACPLAFGEVGVKNRVKSVLNYKRPAFWVVAVAIVASIVVAVCFLTNPKKEIDLGISAQKGGSDLEGVSLEIVNADLSAPDPFFDIKWKNDAAEKIIFGEQFEIFYNQDGKWENCSMEEDPVWHLIAYPLESKVKAKHTYKLNGQIMTQAGKYRFEAPFTIDGKPKTEYKAWIEFELKEGVESMIVHTFKPIELVYDDGMYSFVQTVDIAPTYMLVNGMDLLEKIEDETLKPLGTFEEITLNKDTLDSRFRTYGDSWLGDETLKSLKDNHKRMWQLYGDPKAETPYLYILLEQKDGTFYLGHGYYNCNSSNPANPDDSHIRWLYKVSEGTDHDISVEFQEYDGKKVIKEPPALIVVSNEQCIDALKGTSSWIYEGSGGMSEAVMSDSSHPLMLKESMPFIGIPPAYVSYGDPLGAKLQFNAKGIVPIIEIPPDEIQIRCWEEKYWGQTSAKSENISLNIVNGNLFFKLKDGNYIYEIVATWSSYEKFSGTARYSFYTVKSNPDWDAEPKIDVDSKIEDTYNQTATERIDEAYENEEFVITKTHHRMDDGRWIAGNYEYKYRLEITGRMNNSAKNTTYIVLSNRKDITFDETWKAAGFSSLMSDYFDPKDAVIVGHKLFSFSSGSSDLTAAIAKVLNEKYRADKPDGLLHIETSYLLANETASGTPLLGNSGHMEEATVYLIVHHMKYSVNGGQLKEVAGGFIPTAITFSIDEKGGYSLKEYWTPRSGENYEKDIRAKFPGASAEEALHMDKYAEGLTKESWRKATESLNKINSASSTGKNV